MTTTLLAAFLAFLIGTLLGLLGGGGGILTVPVLIYVVGLGARNAIASSLLVVGVTSAFGAVLAARAGQVRWTTGALFGAGSMAGAYLGGQLAAFVPERWLLVGLALTMLVTALAVLRAPEVSRSSSRGAAGERSVAVGAAVGLLSGLVGAGGGFLLVPALTLFGGLALPAAIGTSLLIISLQSFAGFLGHLGHVQIAWPVLGAMLAAAIVGMVLGRAASASISARTSKVAFATLVASTGLFLLARQLSPLPVATVATLTLFLALRSLRARRAP